MDRKKYDVVLDSVSKEFDNITAMDNVSLKVKKGTFLTLLGPSGCGKTTTLRIIGGFESPTSGRIFLGDRDVTDVPPYKRDTNIIYQIDQNSKYCLIFSIMHLIYCRVSL